MRRKKPVFKSPKLDRHDDDSGELKQGSELSFVDCKHLSKIWGDIYATTDLEKQTKT